MRISVCIATYNGEKYIKEQLNSILSQISEDDEVIVSDDGSSDKTISIIESIRDSRIKIFHNTGRHGFICNFENALQKAKGDYIFLSDQDDIWLPNKVKIIMKMFVDYDLIVHDAELIGANGEILGKNYYSLLHNKTGFWSNLWKNRFIGCCMSFKKEVLNACLPFPKHISGHDFWIGMYAVKTFRVCFIPDVLLQYRRHENNATTSSEKSRLPLRRKISNRWMMLYAVYFRLLFSRTIK